MEAHIPRILIVEDQYFVAVDCEAQLQSAGYLCAGLASTAANVQYLAERERPDLILMDIRLASRRDGVQAAIDIYRQFGIRCIFTSAHADAQIRKQAEPAHPLGWLDKPFTPERLIEAVRVGLAELGHIPSDEPEETPAGRMRLG